MPIWNPGDRHMPPGVTGLVDDAAMFPPGNAPIDHAVREHRTHRASPYASMVGPLLVRDTDVTRVSGLTERPLAIAVIGTSGPVGVRRALAELRDFPHVTVSGVEVPVPPGDLVPTTKDLVSTLNSIAEGATVSVELPRAGAGVAPIWIKAAEEIAEAGFQVKFRTGGIEASGYPSEQELAAVLGALVLRPFKLTAGLHRAVRNSQPGTGFEQHGFLNIMVAVHRLLSGASVDGIVPILRSRDSAALAAIVEAWSEEDGFAVRRAFRGFGCCGVTEPYEDLVDLGLVA